MLLESTIHPDQKKARKLNNKQIATIINFSPEAEHETNPDDDAKDDPAGGCRDEHVELHPHLNVT